MRIDFKPNAWVFFAGDAFVVCSWPNRFVRPFFEALGFAEAAFVHIRVWNTIGPFEGVTVSLAMGGFQEATPVTDFQGAGGTLGQIEFPIGQAPFFPQCLLVWCAGEVGHGRCPLRIKNAQAIK